MKDIIDAIKGLMQPALTGVAVFLFLWGTLNQIWPVEDTFKVIIGIIIFWFGYTGLKSFTYTGNVKPTIVEMKPETPVNPTPVAVNTTPVEPEEPDEPEIPQVEFDTVAFEKAVDDAVVPTYTIKNDSTVFYTARTKLLTTNWTDGGFKQGAKYVLELAKQNFRFIWGLPVGVDPIPYATEHLNDSQGCTTCASGGCTYPDLKFKAMQQGQGYYTAYLDLIEMQRYAA